MNWDKIKKLTGPQDEMEDDDSTQIADEQSLPSKIYETVSPALDMIIPSAEAGNLSQFNPREYLEGKKQKQAFNPKQYLQQAPQPKQQAFVQPDREEIKQFIVDEANRRNIDPSLALAHFDKESSFNPAAFNKKGGGMGARGLTQVRSMAFTDAQKFDKTGTLKNLQMKDMSNPKYWKENVIAGLNYYDAIKKYWKPKSEEAFLKSYNQGSPKAEGYNSEEAKKYAQDILRKREQYKDYVDQLNAQRISESESPMLASENRFNKIRKIIP